MLKPGKMQYKPAQLGRRT